jgi:hypothetical protein
MDRSVVYDEPRPRIVHRRSPSPLLRRATSVQYRHRSNTSPERIRDVDVEETETRVRSRSRLPSRRARVIRVRDDDRDDRPYPRRRSLDSDDENTRRVTFLSSSPRGRSKTKETVTVEDRSGRRVSRRSRSVMNAEDRLSDDHYSPPGKPL